MTWALSLLALCSSLGVMPYTAAIEYCLTETFSPRCPPRELVLVERAQFGRMELGRCVTRNFGHVGCAADVLSQLDWACSGRRACDLSVSDPTLVRTKPCPKDFTSYLDATYRCVPAISAHRNSCRNGLDTHHVTTLQRGFISSSSSYDVTPPRPTPAAAERYMSTASRKPPDSSAAAAVQELPCLVELRYQPGQRVTFTLFDFSPRHPTLVEPLRRPHGGESGDQGDAANPPYPPYVPLYNELCNRMAVIDEPSAGNVVTICGWGGGEGRLGGDAGLQVGDGGAGEGGAGEGGRERVVYTSRSSVVRVQLMAPSTARFMMRFEVTGCADPPLPPDMHFQHRTDRLIAVCNHTGESFVLVCDQGAPGGGGAGGPGSAGGRREGRGWAPAAPQPAAGEGVGRWKGELHNCSRPAAGMSVAIIFGVAIVTVVYVAVIMVCAVHIRRWRKKLRSVRVGAKLRSSMCSQDDLHTAASRRCTVTSRDNCLTAVTSRDRRSAAMTSLTSPSTRLCGERTPMFVKQGQTASGQRYSECFELRTNAAASRTLAYEAVARDRRSQEQEQACYQLQQQPYEQQQQQLYQQHRPLKQRCCSTSLVATHATDPERCCERLGHSSDVCMGAELYHTTDCGGEPREVTVLGVDSGGEGCYQGRRDQSVEDEGGVAAMEAGLSGRVMDSARERRAGPDPHRELGERPGSRDSPGSTLDGRLTSPDVVLDGMSADVKFVGQ